MKHLVLIFFVLLSTFGWSQQTQNVDFKRAKVDIVIDPIEEKVTGYVEYTFDILKPVDSIFFDAIHMTFDNVILNGENIEFNNDKKNIWIKNNFQQDKNYHLGFNYTAYPKQAMYFIGWDDENDDTSSDSDLCQNCAQKNQIWTQGQGKYTSNWLPSIDDMNEKIEFDISITFNSNYQVIANGKLTHKQPNDSTITWHYNMNDPMPSYLVALVVGKYNKKTEYSKSGVPLELYYYPEDSLKFEPTYRYTKRIFDYFEEEIGVPYPWQNYKQVPVKDFLYAGMENTGTTIFSDAFVADSIGFVDRNYVNVNAHELAHQWFGNLVTAKHGSHHWLQEGFATYYALLAERHIFGNNYFYWKLYESAQQLLDQDRQGNGTSLLDPKSSSLTFYQKGAWALHVLKEKVGRKAFNLAVRKYLQTYQFKNAETVDFIDIIGNESGQDLTEFMYKWFESDTFPYEDAMESLKLNSKFINEYLMVDCEVKDSKCDYYLTSYVSDEAKAKIIAQVPDKVISSTFKNSLKVRQAIALNVSEVPEALKQDYESLLRDNSYTTKEAALYNLWVNFPDDRANYLNATKGIHGFNDKNIRTLWLTLAIVTPEYDIENKETYLQELLDYTSPKYGFELRQNAFQFLTMIKACNDICKENLGQATNHHNWRMVKFAKSLLQSL